MNKELISEFADLASVQNQAKGVVGSLQTVMESLVALNKAAAEGIGKGLDGEGGKAGSDNIRQTKKAVTELTLALEAYRKIQDDLAKSKARLAALDSDEAKALAQVRAEIQAINKAQADAAKAAISTQTAYQKLTAQYRAAEAQYREYYITLGAGAAATVAAQKRAKELNATLQTIDRGIGDYRRNVGNYGSAFNGLNVSIQQILREAPSAAVSLNTFFLAISNNLPMFFDELKKAGQALKALQVAQEASNIALVRQTEIQVAAAAAEKAANDALLAQIDVVVERIAVSQEQAAALREEILAQTSAAVAAAENAAAIVSNTEALIINAGANAEDATALATQAEAAVVASRASIEATAAMEAQTIATTEATAAAAAQPSVIKLVAKSLFSVNSLLTLGVLALTLYGGKIVEMFTGASAVSKEAEKALKKYNDAIKEAGVSARKSANEEIARLEMLTAVAKDNTQTVKARTAAVNELQKTYSTTFGALEKQAILEGDLGDAVNRTTQALLDRAAAQAAEKRFAAASENVYELGLNLKEAQKEVDKYDAAVKRNINNPIAFTRAEFSIKLKSAKEDYDAIAKSLAAARKEQEGFLQDALASSKAVGDILTPDEKVKKEKKKKTPKEKRDSPDIFRFDEQSLKDNIAFNNAIVDNDAYSLKQRLDALKDWADASIQLDGRTEKGRIKIQEEARKKEEKLTSEFYDKYQQSIIDNGRTIELAVTAQYQKDKEALDANLNKGLITRKRYNEQLKTLQVNAEKEILDQQLDSIGRQIYAMQALGLNVDKLTKQFQELQIQRNKLSSKPTSDEKDLGFGLTQEKLDNFKKAVDIAKVFNEELQQAAQMFSQMYQNRINQLENEKSASKDRWDKEIDAINTSSLLEKDKTKRVAEVKAQAAAEEERINQKIAQQKRKQAIADKIGASSAIIQNTAVAITKVLGELPPPLNFIAAGVIGTLGAVQLAQAISTPIPQYAEGTKDHPGGLAILGDGGQRELVKEPGKSPYWSSDTDTVYDLKPHTQVIPEDEVQKSMYRVAPGGIIVKSDNSKVVRAVQDIGDKISATIRRKKEVVFNGRSSRFDKLYHEITRK